MKIVKPPKFIRKINKNLIWSIPNDKNEVFLTFDDCKDEEVTLWVLDLLDEYNLKATFFCSAKYVEYSKLHLEIKRRGHIVANHGYAHLNGFKTNVSDYVSDVLKASAIIESHLFRPPYGKIRPSQINVISKNFRIIMWDVLSYDFDSRVLPVECYENVKKNIVPGSIIVFHTIKKAERNLKYALPASIEYLLTKSFNPSMIL